MDKTIIKKKFKNNEWLRKTENKLFNCPMCGGRPRLYQQELGFLIKCDVCRLTKPCEMDSQRAIMAAWNKRALVNEWKKIIFKIDEAIKLLQKKNNIKEQ